MEEWIVSESKPKIRKLDSDENDVEFECYDRSEGKPVHVDIVKKITEGNKPTLSLILNRSEEEESNNKNETRDGDGNIYLRRSNRIIKPLERLNSVPYF